MSRILVATILLMTVGARSAAGQRPDPRFEPTYGTAFKKSPTAARVIGIFPGAGHVYAGESGRGLKYLGGVLMLPVVPVFLVGTTCYLTHLTCSVRVETLLQISIGAAVGLYGWSIFDAGRAAHRANARQGLRMTPPIIIPRRFPSTSGSTKIEVQVGFSATFP